MACQFIAARRRSVTRFSAPSSPAALLGGHRHTKLDCTRSSWPGGSRRTNVCSYPCLRRSAGSTPCLEGRRRPRLPSGRWTADASWAAESGPCRHRGPDESMPSDRPLVALSAGQVLVGDLVRCQLQLGVYAAQPASRPSVAGCHPSENPLTASARCFIIVSMTRNVFAERKLRGSASSSAGAVACSIGQSLDHEQWLGIREPVNTGRPVILCS